MIDKRSLVKVFMVGFLVGLVIQFTYPQLLYIEFVNNINSKYLLNNFSNYKSSIYAVGFEIPLIVGIFFVVLKILVSKLKN